MNMFTSTKKHKKFILILVLLILFNFFYPKKVNAGIGLDDLEALPLKIIWWAEKGILVFLNNIFTDDEHEATESTIDSTYNATNLKIFLTPENIIKGKFLLFDANIFREIEDTGGYFDYEIRIENGQEVYGAVVKGRIELRENVAGWYYSLRNFAIVALLCILVYVGIRMITSTISQDKAKYKTMFKDWLVALCLLVVMHYIMIAVLETTTAIVETLGRDGENADLIGKFSTRISGMLTESYKNPEGTAANKYAYKYVDEEEGVTYGIGDGYAYAIVILGIIGYTVIFAVKYLIREFTIIFLILLGPISCITYPIDKISDGKAQAYNKWLTEFIYQVLIQPFHLLLYIVLIGTAAEMATENVIYAIVCFAVMIPAEKFVKSMFGFKDSLGSPLGAFAGGAIASQLFSKMKGGSSAKSGGSSKDDGSSADLPGKVKQTELPGAEGKSGTDNGAGNGNGSESNDGDVKTVDEQGEAAQNDDESVDTVDEPEPAGQSDDESVEAQGKTENNDEGNSEGENNPEKKRQSKEKKRQSNWIAKGAAAVRDKYNKKVFKANGTAGFLSKDLAKKRAARVGKWALKTTGKVIKGAVTLSGGVFGSLVLGGIGAMFGKGKEAALTGGAFGSKVGSAVGDLGGKVVSGAGDYIGTFYDAATGKDKDKEKYKQNNADRASRDFKERNGYRGSGREINEELDRMYKMTQHGVKDSQIEDTMQNYYNNKKNGMNETDAENSAIQSALLAQDYTRKDFSDPKKMEEAYNTLMAQYSEAGITGPKADEYVRNILGGAGSLRGVSNVALPPRKEKVTLPSRDNLYGRLKFGNDATSQVQREQVQAIQDVLIDIGFNDSQIKQVMDYSTGDTNEEIITSFATNVHYIVSNDISTNSTIEIGEIKSGRFKQEIKVEEGTIKENLEKLDIRAQTGITEEQALSKMRDLEKKKGTTEFRAEGGKMIRGEYSKNDKNNLSEKALEMAEGYKRASTVMNPNTSKKKQSRKK